MRDCTCRFQHRFFTFHCPEEATADDCPEFSSCEQDVRYAHVLSPVRRRVHRRHRRVTPAANMVFACVRNGVRNICRHTHKRLRQRPNINIRLLWEVINIRGEHGTSLRTQPGGERRAYT